MRNVSGIFKRSNSRRLALGLAVLLAGVLLAGSSPAYAGPSATEQAFIDQGWLKTDASGNPIKTTPPNVDSVIDDPVGGTGLVIPAEFWERVGAAAIRTMMNDAIDNPETDVPNEAVDSVISELSIGIGMSTYESGETFDSIRSAAGEGADDEDSGGMYGYGPDVLGALGAGGGEFAILYGRLFPVRGGGDPDVGTPDVEGPLGGGSTASATSPTSMPPVEPPVKMEKVMKMVTPSPAALTPEVVSFICALNPLLYFTSGGACTAK